MAALAPSFYGGPMYGRPAGPAPGTTPYEQGWIPANAGGLGYGATPPSAPNFLSAQGPTGSLLPQYMINQPQSVMPTVTSMLNNAQYDPTALNFLQNYGASTGPSPWANIQTEANKNAIAQQLGQANAGQNAANASAVDELAQHGGLRTGALQNIAIQGGKNLMATRQGIQQAGNQNELGILGQDEQNKLQALNSAMFGAGQQADLGQQAANLWGNLGLNQNQQNLGQQEFNANQAFQNLTNQNLYNSNLYNQNMSAWAAAQQANAQAQQGGHGFLGLSWIVSRINESEPWTHAERVALRHLFKKGLARRPKLTRRYLKDGLTWLLAKMTGADFSELKIFVQTCLSKVAKGETERAVDLYARLFLDLRREYAI